MAKISFRQGIVSHPKNSTTGTQTFLRNVGSNVDLIIDTSTSSEPILITFAHQDTDYLYTEANTVESAWTDIPTNQDVWLFWEINLRTGHLERDFTTLEPLYQQTQPTVDQRVLGQMWFDIKNSTFRVWQGRVWIEVIRVMAARLTNGTIFQSLSINADDNDYEGTQVGIYLGQRFRRSAGSLVYNSAGNAIKSGKENQFFTTEDTFLTGVPTGASLRINNSVVTGTAQCPIAAYQVVQYNNYNEICLVNTFDQGSSLFGIVEFDIEVGEIATLNTGGVIFNEAWDWEAAGASPNTPLYIDSISKTLTTTSGIANNLPVAVVIGRREVFFAPRLFPQVNTSIVASGGGLTPAQLQQLNDATTNSDTNTAYINQKSIDNEFLADRITENEVAISKLQAEGSLSLTGGTLTGPLTLPIDPPIFDQHAATKAYVDDLIAGFNTDISVSDWSEPTGPQKLRSITILQATHKRPLSVNYNVLVFNSMNNRISIDYNVNTVTGTVTILTAGLGFSGKVRII